MGEQRRRVYHDWPGNDTFFCDGRCVAGPAWTALLGTSALILAPCAVWLGLVVPDVAREYSWALFAIGIWLPVFSVVCLWLTGCSDPGIIPRIAAPTADEFPAGRPRSVEALVNGKKVTLKWNDSTNFYQPPRAHHCSVSNDCVEKFDHHCPWVGTTIGQRNYRTFLLFVFNTTLLCVYIFALSAVQVQLKHKAGTGITAALARCPAAIALMVYAFLAIWFVGGLSGFHCYLVSTNQTTYENFRYTYKAGESPYDRGCLSNWLEALCAPRLPRKVDFRAFIEDVEAASAVVDRTGRPLSRELQPAAGCCGAGEPLKCEVEMVTKRQASGGAGTDALHASPPSAELAAAAVP